MEKKHIYIVILCIIFFSEFALATNINIEASINKSSIHLGEYLILVNIDTYILVN